MKGFYDQNGLLQSSYQLSNIVSLEGDEISLCIPEEVIPMLYFRFQSQKFRLRDITDSLDDESNHEIFPGIYIRSVESESKLKKWIHRFFKKKLYILRNENLRDYFRICSELEEKRLEYHDGDIMSTQIEHVNPQNVEQPGNLGGGRCGGCPVYSYFNRLGVLGEYDINGYYFFRDEEAIEATRKEEFFLDKCRYSTCFQTYEKILKEGYSEELEMRDQIKVQYQNGRYSAGEGKHRVCVMRRFGYSNIIPMRVTRVSDRGERTDLADETTLGQVDPKPSWARTQLAQEANTSERQVTRFIALTELLPELLEMVDNKQLGFNPAVEISYLTKENQEGLLYAMDYAQAIPSLSQAQRMKKMQQAGLCNKEA